jgi:predicted oxidoreductase
MVARQCNNKSNVTTNKKKEKENEKVNYNLFGVCFNSGGISGNGHHIRREWPRQR